DGEQRLHSSVAGRTGAAGSTPARFGPRRRAGLGSRGLDVLPRIEDALRVEELLDSLHQPQRLLAAVRLHLFAHEGGLLDPDPMSTGDRPSTADLVPAHILG